MKETELKKLFQKKFAERELPYNAASWEKLSLMLDQASIPWYAKSGVWIKAAGSIATISMAGLLYFYSGNEEIKNPELLDNNAQESITPKQNVLEEKASSAFSSPNRTAESIQNEETNSSLVQSASTSSTRTSNNKTVAINQNTSLSAQPSSSFNSASLTDLKSDRESMVEESLESSFMEWKAKKLPNFNSIENSLPSALAPAEKSTISRIRWRPSTHWSFGIHSLIGMSSSLKNTSDGSSSLNAFGLGLSAKYYFASIWTIETNLNYTRRSGMQMNREILGTSFGFGAEEEKFAVETHSIDFIEVPIFLGIRLAPSHRFKAGYYFAPIINIRNEVTHSLKPMNSDVWEHSTHSESGYSEAFEKLDHGWAFGYEWTPNARFGIGLDYLHGLTDLSIDAHFNENYVDLNRQVKLRLAYYFY